LILFMSFLSTLFVTIAGSSIAISPGLRRPDPPRRPGAAAARRGTSQWFRRSSGRLRILRLPGSRRLVLPRAVRRRTRGAGVRSVRSVWSLFPPLSVNGDCFLQYRA
jgi:hypothetical protein